MIRFTCTTLVVSALVLAAGCCHHRACRPCTPAPVVSSAPPCCPTPPAPCCNGAPGPVQAYSPIPPAPSNGYYGH